MEEAGRRRFEMERCLGRGGFGEVYLATMVSPGGLKTAVAVKVLLPDLDVRTDAVRRLRDEGRLLARLNHPTILKVYDLTRLEGRVALVTEYVDGADLCDCWVGDDAVSVRAVLQAISAVASALEQAWLELQLVHRDIKPTNIRIGRHGEVRLLDFGIAYTDTQTREASTQTGLVVGSLPYMAPERFTDKDVLPSSDVYSLGCTLFEAVTGGRRFVDGSLREMTALALDDIRYQNHRLQVLGRLDVDKRVKDLIGELLAYYPDDRPKAGEVAARCDALADELKGATLRAWARDRHWAEAHGEDGELVGRTLTEGSLGVSKADVTGAGQPAVLKRPLMTVDPGQTVDPSSGARPAPEPPAPSRKGWLVVGGVLGTAGLVAVGVAVLGVLAVGIALLVW